MLIKSMGFAWKLLPGWVRLRVIRATQAKFTVSTAAIITNGEGKVLLLNHAFRPFSGWGMPGGFVDHGEDPDETIRREIREEIGLELEDLEMFRVRTLGRHVEILFRARGVGEAAVLSPREILEFGWFDIDAMPDGLSRGQRELIRQQLTIA